ncbi:hypothetical protein QY96_02857 [Bacillus thermotolerans]|nr:hypothetical protein QY96_02857 [Bacillus thermotolerans]
MEINTLTGKIKRLQTLDFHRVCLQSETVALCSRFFVETVGAASV